MKQQPINFHTINNQKTNTNRVPPSAVEVEEQVLGAAIFDHEALAAVMHRCTTNHFYAPRNRHVFDAMAHLFDYDTDLDMLLIEQRLKDTNTLDQIGGRSYLAGLARTGGSAANIDYHIQILEEKKMLREEIQDFSELVNSAYKAPADPYEILDRAAALIDKLSDGTILREGRPIAAGLAESLQWIHERRENPRTVTGVPAGLDIDEFTGGWQDEDLIVIAARPSMGKTALALTAARNAALYAEGDYPGVIFSLEMGETSLINRFVSMEAQIGYDDLRAGRVNDSQFNHIAGKIADKLLKASVIIDDTPSLSLRAFKTKVRKYYRKYAIKWAMIDYLQLMELGGGRETTDEKIGAVTRGLKLIAKELGIPVILLSQLSRAVEQRGGSKRPQLSDLRASGNIEQDADLVIFLYRPEYYGVSIDENNNPTEGMAELIISKQRNGPLATVKLNFAKQFGEFRNQSYQHAEDPATAPF